MPRQLLSRVADHLMIWGVATATLTVFTVARDPIRGSAEVSDAVPLTISFVLAGYYLAGLPWLWTRAETAGISGIVLPGFMTLVLAHFVFVCQAGFIQPGATALAVIAQVTVLVTLFMRAQ